MVVERGECMDRGEDDDRPAGPFVKLAQEAPVGPRDLADQRRDARAEKSHRPPRAPAEGKAQRRLRDQERVEQVMGRLGRELHPARVQRRHLVPGDQPPGDARDDHRGEQHPERHVRRFHELLLRLGEPVPRLRQREIGDDQDRRRPVQRDGDTVVARPVVPRGNPRGGVESGPGRIVHIAAR